MSAGETVAVLGAAGGVGSAMVQLSIAEGARVIAVVGDHSKAELCGDLGAETVVHPDPDADADVDVDSAKALRELTDGRGVDVILDPVQGEPGARARAGLAIEGRHVVCGSYAGLIPHDPSIYWMNQSIIGADLSGVAPDVMQRWHAESEAHLDRLVSGGRYRPIIDRVVPFDQAREAVGDLAQRRVAGRVVVQVAGSA